MPVWLPSVLAAVGISLVGQAIAYIMLVKVLGIRVDDHDRRISHIEESKLDRAHHELEVRRIDGTVSTLDNGLRSAGHRMNGIDQRITSVDDRIKPSGRSA